MARRQVALVGVAALLAGVAGGWGARTVLTPPEPVPTESEYAVVAAEEDAVSVILEAPGFALWETELAGTNNAQGIITGGIAEAGETVSQCDAIFRIDDVPVVIAMGEIPAYRDLEFGAQGDDVAQLQGMLAACGYLATEPDGVFGTQTRAAVREWQESQGVTENGIVEFGEVIFVPSLPSRVVLDPEVVSRGARLGGGEDVVHTLALLPRFSVSLTSMQAQQVQIGGNAQIELGTNAGAAVIVSLDFDAESQSYTAILQPEGECGDLCQGVSVDGTTPFSAVITVVPETRGIVIPAAAITVTADGSTAVVLEDGTAHVIELLVRAGGRAVVDGIDAGTRIRVPGG